MVTTVTTQAELDAALAAKATEIVINSPAGVWLTVSQTPADASGRPSSHVVARGSSHVVARGSSHVEARGSSHVVAWGSSHVEAWGSSHVEAWESSHVVAWGSSHVVAWGSSHVVARESSHVVARESSHVVARGSSHVVARESSHVVAWGSSHVEASPYVSVHLHSARVELSGGQVIDITQLDLKDVATWQAYTGAVMLLDDDGRGYRLGYRSGRYFAGCRDFTADEAIAHWSSRPDAPGRALLAAVQAHIASIKSDA